MKRSIFTREVERQIQVYKNFFKLKRNEFR